MTPFEGPALHDAYDMSSWSSLVRDSVLPFDVELPAGRGFHGSVRRSTLFDLGLFSMQCHRHSAHRGRKQLAATPREELVVSFQRTGRLHVAQNDRRTRVDPGEFVVYGSFDPVQIEGSDHYRSLCVKIPLSRCRDTPAQLREITARKFSAEDGLAPLVWTMIEQLESRAADTSAASASRVSHHIIGLVEHMFHQQLGTPEPVADSRAERILSKCQAYIASRLHDPELAPARVAEASFISTRYLHLLFEQTDTTVAAYIRDQRIERVKEDLSNPRYSEIPIDALARRWGFANVSHFGQLFKRATGHAPGQYRELVLRQFSVP